MTDIKNLMANVEAALVLQIANDVAFAYLVRASLQDGTLAELCAGVPMTEMLARAAAKVADEFDRIRPSHLSVDAAAADLAVTKALCATPAYQHYDSMRFVQSMPRYLEERLGRPLTDDERRTLLEPPDEEVT